MANSIEWTTLPLTVTGVALGFYSPGVVGKSSKCRKIITVHCCVTTISVFLVWAVLVGFKLARNEYSFFNFALLLLDMVRITVLTYYRVKCLRHHDIISDICRSIDCADERLERAGIGVPYKTHRLQCVGYTAVINLVCVVFWVLDDSRRTKRVPDETYAHHRYNVLGESYSVYNVLFKSTSVYSIIVLVAQLTFLLHLVYQRLRLLRRAVQKTDKYFGRKIAWSSDVMVSVSPYIPTSTIHERYWMEVRKLNNCLCEALSKVGEFYKHLCLLDSLFFVLVIPTLLLFSMMEGDVVYFVWVVGGFTVTQIALLSSCHRVGSELKTVETHISRLYWSNSSTCFDVNTRSMRAHLLRCIHKDRDIDCGYFKMDVQFLYLLFDFMSLLLFAMVPLYA